MIHVRREVSDERTLDHTTFFMARRFRRKSFSRRRRPRRTRRRAGKALRMVRALSRKVAAEVKKADAVALLQPPNYDMVLGDVNDASPYTLRDWGNCYPVFGNGDV